MKQRTLKIAKPKITKESLALALTSPDKRTQRAATKFLKKQNAKVKVSGDLSDFEMEPKVQRYLADNRMEMGFSLKPLKKVASKAKSVAKKVTTVAKKAAPSMSVLLKAAKIAGPAISLVAPEVGIPLMAATALASKAQDGAKDAQAKINQIKTAAKAGVALAKQQSGMLELAAVVKKAGDAKKLLTAKAAGDPIATQKIEDIKAGMEAGNPEAKESFEALANANLATMLPKPGEAVPAPVIAKAGLSKNTLLIGGLVAAAGVGLIIVRRK